MPTSRGGCVAAPCAPPHSVHFTPARDRCALTGDSRKGGDGDEAKLASPGPHFETQRPHLARTRRSARLAVDPSVAPRSPGTFGPVVCALPRRGDASTFRN